MSYSYRSSSPGRSSSRGPSNSGYQGRGRSGSGSRGGYNRSAGSTYIDPSRFIKKAEPTVESDYTPKHSFSDFALNQLLRTNLAAKGYTEPSPIQDQAIPFALEGKDVIGIASTGTGKTAAFALPLLEKLMTDRNSAALIIAPTRELAQQIEQECSDLAKNSNLQSALLIGGSSMGRQLRDLRYNPRIVFGTPGRIKDHMNRGTLKLHHFNVVVLDEVDRMLDMGFINDMTEILSNTNAVRQCLFFSATMDPRVRRLVENFTHDPVAISLQTTTASSNVNQDVVRYNGTTDKITKLHDLLLEKAVTKVIVFDETQRNVERLHKELVSRGFTTEAIHGGKSQGQRQRALARFKQNEVNILVATDVAARGLDVTDISHVVNYSIPKVFDDYVHRVGRAGRAGRTGHALTFIAH